jgi:glutaryl-CoA dehydrogenase
LRPEHITVGRLNNMREDIEIAREARTILAATASRSATSLAHANNLESVLTHEDTSEVHTLVLGNAITSIPAFR